VTLLGALGFEVSDVTEGCSECRAPWEQAEFVRQVGRGALLAWVIGALVNEQPSVRGWYRCEPCNRRRGGAPDSSHLRGDAVDRDYSARAGAIIARLAKDADFIAALKQVLGIERIGLIVYKESNGRRAVHTDARSGRSRDWIDVQ